MAIGINLNDDFDYPKSETIYKPNDVVILTRAFKIFRDLGNGQFDVCDTHGNCLQVSENEILISQLNNGNTMKAMKDAVYTTAKQLLKANNTVTTLEVKNELRRDYPYYFWTQDVVSKFMAQLAGDGVLNYKDNGTYRIYSLANTTPAKSIPASPIVKVQSRRTKAQKPSKYGVIFRSSVANFVDGASNSFEAVTLSSGKTVDRNTIRNQKKSLLGYILPKLHNVVSITAAGKTYLVK